MVVLTLAHLRLSPRVLTLLLSSMWNPMMRNSITELLDLVLITLLVTASRVSMSKGLEQVSIHGQEGVGP